MNASLISIARTTLSVLTGVAAFLTGIGVLTALATKNEFLGKHLLNLYPRYELAMEGFEVLQNMQFPLEENGTTTNLAVLTVDDPSWHVLVDFLESERAVLKSERNEPSPIYSQAGEASQEADSAPLPPINFDRIKTIVSIRVGAMISAGPKPLTAPYRLIVIWPDTPRRVYEFYSFQEFGIDLRHMILEEMEALSLWLSALAFGCGVPIAFLRWITQDRRGKIADT